MRREPADHLSRSGCPAPLGHQLRFDEEQQRYQIPGAYYLPSTNFTPEEALSLIVLCHEMGERGQIPFYEPAQSAAVKLENILPDRLRQHLKNVAGSVQIKLQSVNQLNGQRGVYEQLVEAVSRRRCVRITYSSPVEQETIRTKLSPYRLLFSRRSWYVIGRSSVHRTTRMFNVGRILDLNRLDDPYRVPRGFSVDRYLRNAWHLIPEPGPDHRVIIRFSKLVAQNVSEVAWHKTQRVVFNNDGTLDYHVTVSGLSEISWWVLGYGDQAEVIQPRKLRKIVAERAARCAKQYQDV